MQIAWSLPAMNLQEFLRFWIFLRMRGVFFEYIEDSMPRIVAFDSKQMEVISAWLNMQSLVLHSELAKEIACVIDMQILCRLLRIISCSHLVLQAQWISCLEVLGFQWWYTEMALLVRIQISFYHEYADNSPKHLCLHLYRWDHLQKHKIHFVKYWDVVQENQAQESHPNQGMQEIQL